VPDDQIRAALEQEGLQMGPVNIEPGELGALGRIQPGTPSLSTEQAKQYQPGEKSARVGRSIAVGAAALASAPFTAGMSLLPYAVTQGVLAGGADIGMQALGKKTGMQAEIRPKESVRVAKSTAYGAAGAGLLARAAGEFVGIAPELIRRARGKVPGAGFGLTTKAPPATAEHRLGQRVQQALGNIERTITGGRLQKQQILNQADAAGVRIDPRVIANSLRTRAVPMADERSARQFNATIDDFANRLAARGPMRPGDLDRYIIDQIDKNVFKAAGGPRETRMAKALAEVRETAVESLISNVEKAGFSGIREANRAAELELMFRERADKVFGPGRLSLEERLRNLFQPGHEAEKQLLKEIGDHAGVDLLDEARRLATRRAFTTDPRKGSDPMMGVFRQIFYAPLARLTARITAPLQPFGGPVAGAYKEYRTEGGRERRRQEAQAALEQALKEQR